MKTILTSLLFISLFCFSIQAQNTDKVLLVHISYGFHLPGGDLADRFEQNSSVGLGLEYIAKSNWSLGLDGAFMFGTEVKEDVLASIRGPEGIIYGDDGGFAEIGLRQRMWNLGVNGGRLFPLFKHNKRSGIKTSVGLGVFQHKIRVQNDPQVFVAQVAGDAKKGYDRLTNGLAINQFIGYQHLSINQRVNFYAGIELTQAFTQNRRDWNVDTLEKDETNRLDLLFGIRLGWSLPFYIGVNADDQFYD